MIKRQTGAKVAQKAQTTTQLPSQETLLRAFRLMATAKTMTEHYEANFKFVSKYVHATSRGHEAIQIALGLQLLPQDYAWPYYRDDSMLLAFGMRPYDLMLQLMAKRDDPFSGGRSYYCHPSLKDAGKPKIPHQSSATGMQAIPATGAALGIWYKEQMRDHFYTNGALPPTVVCSLGDASVTEGEIAEAFQMAVLKQLPILYLVQDNGWDISANAKETRVANAAEYAQGFPGLEAISIDGSDFNACWSAVNTALQIIRTERRPVLLHARVPLLNHHTSGVRKEWYRDDLAEHQQRDPYPKLRALLVQTGVAETALQAIENEAIAVVSGDFENAKSAPDPTAEDLYTHEFAPPAVVEVMGERSPVGKDATVMVDCALFAINEAMKSDPSVLLYGQDVGRRLGGVFREAATLAEKFGDHRVFNTPIQEAFIVGSTVGMSAVGLKPIVEVQFADYIWPGLNQLFTEVSRSCYLSNGKWPVSCVIRVPIGAYGSGGPYHSSSVESVLSNIRGIKIAYPSNGADLKGLLKSAILDPNPVVMLEHKGLYWSKVPGTEAARTIEPDEHYAIPFGQAHLVLEAGEQEIETGTSLVVITYGMGVHWATNAAQQFPGRVSVLDLRTIAPLDEAAIYEQARLHGKVLVVTEEPANNSFAQSIAGRISEHCFRYLDAPVRTLGAVPMPAVPLNAVLEAEMIPSIKKVGVAIQDLLNW
jgi:2-oxoisovalerate dehydrogenase E1 component